MDIRCNNVKATKVVGGLVFLKKVNIWRRFFFVLVLEMEVSPDSTSAACRLNACILMLFISATKEE